MGEASCWWGGSCKARAMTANSAPLNGWRCASSPAPTHSPGLRRHLRNFKRRPVAPHHKPLRRLRQVDTWSDSDLMPNGRSVTVRLTHKSNKAIARDPFEVLVRAVDSLEAEEQTAMHDALHHVLTALAASGAHRHFGVCHDCAYLGGEPCCSSTSATGSALECGLFKRSDRAGGR